MIPKGLKWERQLREICFKFNRMYVVLNTLWTGDADLRLYITTVQDG